MKLLIAFFIAVLIGEMIYATGAPGEDPNMALSTSSGSSEAGSTFTSAVSKSDQPAFCEKCEERTGARLSNNVGVLTTVTGASSSKDSSGKSVKTEQ